MKIELPQSIELKKHSGFWKQIGMIIIGTTISLVLTISASVALELNERANDRRLSALMVMGTIEDFANGIEEQAPVIDEFYTPHLKPEGLNTLEVYKKQLDSIKAHQSLE